MTRHLDEVELVDALDGRLTPSLEEHLQACASCTARVRALTDAVAGLQPTAGVPEPSPLYWEHFSRRVHDAVRENAIGQQRTRWWRRVHIAALTAAALVAIALATVVLQQARPSDSREAPSVATQSPPEEPPQPGVLDVDGDPDWALVRAVAVDLYREDAPDAGIHARPGSADRVADEMSPAERQELARLLEDELKRTGA